MRTAALLPDADTLHLEALVADAERITVVVTTRGEAACCPDCGEPSRQLHSRKRRRLADLPWQGLAVCLDLQLRRFYCRAPTGARRTFTERVPTVVAPYARRTRRLAAVVEAIAFALGGEPGRGCSPPSASASAPIPCCAPSRPRRCRRCRRRASSASTTGRGDAASRTAPSWWTLSAIGRSTCCPIATRRPSPPGCASVRALRSSAATGAGPMRRAGGKARRARCRWPTGSTWPRMLATPSSGSSSATAPRCARLRPPGPVTRRRSPIRRRPRRSTRAAPRPPIGSSASASMRRWSGWRRRAGRRRPSPGRWGCMRSRCAPTYGPKARPI